MKKNARLESITSSLLQKPTLITVAVMVCALSFQQLAFAVRTDISKIKLPKDDVAQSGKLIQNGNLTVEVSQVKRLDEKAFQSTLLPCVYISKERKKIVCRIF